MEASRTDASLNVMVSSMPLVMGRGAIAESDGGGLYVPAGCHEPESLALGATEEPEVCFYHAVGPGGWFVGVFLSCL